MTEGRSLRVGCLRFSYLFVDRTPKASHPPVADEAPTGPTQYAEPVLQVVFVAGRRTFRRATARNRIKRWLREAFRTQKNLLIEAISGKRKGVILAIQCQQRDVTGYSQVADDLQQGLLKVAQRWQAYYVCHDPEPTPDLPHEN